MTTTNLIAQYILKAMAIPTAIIVGASFFALIHKYITNHRRNK